MKIWRLGTRKDGLLGYRIKTDCNNMYDIRTNVKMSNEKITDRIVGFVRDGVFKTDDNDVVVELENDSPSAQVLLTAISDNANGMFGFDVLSGEKLKKVISEYDKLNKRKYVNVCIKNLLDTSYKSFDIVELFGVRRTGKTVSMFHMMSGLLEKGVDLKDIWYISLNKDCAKNGISDDYIFDVLTFLTGSEGAKYVFIDEITYLDGKFNFLTSYADGYQGDTKLVISGTNSSVFLIPNVTNLYDRILKVKTTWISFKEYNKIFPGSTVLDYIRSGGILKRRDDYSKLFEDDLITEESEIGNEYIRSSVYDNILNGFRRYRRLNEDYPEMYKLFCFDLGGSSGYSLLKTILIKYAQNYSNSLVVDVILEVFKSADVGSSFDLYSKNHNIDENDVLLGDKTKTRSRKIKSVLNKYVSESLDIHDFNEIYKDSGINLNNLVKDIRKYLKKIDCFYELPVFLGDTCEYILPVIIRYGLACSAVVALRNNWGSFCRDLGIDSVMGESVKADLIAGIHSGVEGCLCEEVIRMNLDYSKSMSTGKYRDFDSGAEVDILYEDDIIEVKRSDKASKYQARWLLSEKVGSRFSGKRRVILTNDENERVEEWSEKDALFELREMNIRRGLKTKSIDRALVTASDVKQKVHCLNMTKYLLERVVR